MTNFPRVVTMPFADGYRDVPEHLAALMKMHDMATHEMTYVRAVEQVNLLNTRHLLNKASDKLISEHLRNFGQ